MKFIAILLTSIFLCIGLYAQQTHFIYIQTNNRQQFYVNLDKKIYSSSASGYVIIPKLIDGTYNLTIGFPKNQWPQQNFTTVINAKDIGYVLTNFGEKGWGLFNLQSMQVAMASGSVMNNAIATEDRTDSFSNMLSAVVNDPSIRKKPIEKPEVKMDTVQVQKETVIVNNNADNATSVTQVIKEEKPVTRSVITKILSISNNEGTELVYVDKTADSQDTIRILIPADKKIEASAKVEKPVVEEAIKEEPKTTVAKADNIVSTPVSVDTTIITTVPRPSVKKTDKKSNVKVEKDTIETITATTTAVSKNDCNGLATDEDFLKLRKKMAAATTNDEMMSLAKKVFKTKCFKTDQIKNLSFLFLDDQGKYQFFAVAYSFVSDPENFSTLEGQLSDSNYIKRFKAMIAQ